LQGLRYSFSQRSLYVRLPILQNNVAAGVNHCGAHIFSTERNAARPRYAYFPFSGGPRQCIGNEFSLLESIVILAMVTQRYNVNLAPGFQVLMDSSFALRPRGGVQVTLDKA
jgi:cytochrome P450